MWKVWYMNNIKMYRSYLTTYLVLLWHWSLPVSPADQQMARSVYNNSHKTTDKCIIIDKFIHYLRSFFYCRCWVFYLIWWTRSKRAPYSTSLYSSECLHIRVQRKCMERKVYTAYYIASHTSSLHHTQSVDACKHALHVTALKQMLPAAVGCAAAWPPEWNQTVQQYIWTFVYMQWLTAVVLTFSWSE